MLYSLLQNTFYILVKSTFRFSNSSLNSDGAIYLFTVTDKELKLHRWVCTVRLAVYNSKYRSHHALSTSCTIV